MLRILRFTTNRSLGPQDALKAIEASREAAKAAEKVPGVKSCTFYLGNGAFIFAAESEGYAAADAALANPGVQAAFGRLGQEYGLGVNQDEFFLDPQQVYPFIQR
jgi:hypothetical protein